MPQSHKLDYLKFGVGCSDRALGSIAGELPQLSLLDAALLQSSLNISIYFNDNCGQSIAKSRDEMHIMQITIVLMKAYCTAKTVRKAPNWWKTPQTPHSSMTAPAVVCLVSLLVSVVVSVVVSTVVSLVGTASAHLYPPLPTDSPIGSTNANSFEICFENSVKIIA